MIAVKVAALFALATVALAANPVMMNTLSFRSNLRVNPFVSMPQPNYALIDGATIAIEAGFAAGMDKLTVDYQGFFDIRGTFDSTLGILYLRGTAPISEYSAALASVVFMTTSEDGSQRKITFTYGDSTFYSSSTRHFYKIVQSPNSAWTDAASGCNALKYMNMKGYLATITSQEEMTAVSAKINQPLWIGGNLTGNQWYWSFGPEANTAFWTGPSVFQGGAPSAPFAFSAWERFQPNGDGMYLRLKPSLEAGYANFDDSNGIASYICEFGGMDDATTASTYSWFMDSVILNLDCTLFDSQSECANRKDLGCSWTGGSCASSACSTFSTQAQCASNWQCTWNTNGDLGTCVTTGCAQYGSISTCLNPTCSPSVFGGALRCMEAKCSDLASGPACAQNSMCEWRDKCINANALDCSGTDTVLLLDGTTALAEEFGKYTSGFFALTQLLLEGDLGLTKTAAGAAVGSAFGQRYGLIQYGGSSPLVSPSGTGSSGRMTGSVDELAFDLKWQQQAYSASLTTRSLKSGLQAAQSMFAGSTRRKVLVIFSAGPIEDAAALQTAANAGASDSVLKSLRDAGVSILGVTLRPTPTTTAMTSGAQASLAQITAKTMSVTMAEVMPRVIYGLCGNASGTAGALIPAASQGIDCTDHASKTECNRHLSCQWDNADSMCQNSQCLQLSQSLCGTQSACTYDATMMRCVQKCPKFTASSDCIADANCAWSAADNLCSNKACISNIDEDSCLAESGCRFTTAGCIVVPCQFTNNADCVASAGCAWSSLGQCYKDSCGSLATSALCGARPECVYNPDTARCQTNPCGLMQDESSCVAQVACLWNVGITPARCTPAPCTSLKQTATTSAALQTACKANTQCYWQPQSENGFADMCVVKKCEMNKRSCDCAAQSGCVWRNEACKTSVFVQCPATDVMFLVEATSVMKESFSRHPNGFQGIVEAIRAWSKDAPLAATLQSTGFRLAIAGYGNPGTAMTASASVGAMGAFTGDIEQWSGAKQELDSFLSMYTNYANAAGSSVSVTAGLKRALTMFQAAPAGRKRLLIVLGAQPVTDGSDSTAMTGSVISQLEGLGVQIFTNVIRRFSETSAVEMQAAALLAPVASDPASSHFQYTTIDQLTSNLLDNFCDPSTLTGKALQISRDGTLPCNWLESATECAIQPSCAFNATAVKTCPLPGQCPNLDCQSLPASLVKLNFACKDCVLVSGAFQCDKSMMQTTAATGLCQQSACMAGCSQASCSGACSWSTNSSRCERSMCTSTTLSGCIADLGCVWASAMPTRGAGCLPSMCGKSRSSDSCAANTFSGIAGSVCKFDETFAPAICKEKRCIYLTQADCATLPVNCQWDTSINKCLDRECQYTSNEACEMDALCYWDPFQSPAGSAQRGTCFPRSNDCVLSDYSPWSEWSANCGANAIRTKSRTILSFPSATGQDCASVAARGCQPTDKNCQSGDTNIVVSQTNTGLPSCDAYCAGIASAMNCAEDISCQWKAGTCAKKSFYGCGSYSQTDCAASDMCAWDATKGFCVSQISICRQTDSNSCGDQTRCMWRTGASANALAASIMVPAQLVNPNQEKIFVFPTINIIGEMNISGAAVTIESNFQRGKDILEVSYPANVMTRWDASAGTLFISGMASLTEYGAALRFVTFRTSSTRAISRTITWSFGAKTLYSASTNHWYTYVAQSGVSWETARANCATSSLYGMQGYLATVASDAENSLLSGKLNADGWISGDDYNIGVWTFSSGPEMSQPFWTGDSPINGGYAAPGQYGNWDPVANEPRRTSGSFSHPYLNASGFWNTQTDAYTSALGYVCEFGGLSSDVLTNTSLIGGSSVIGVGGCVPAEPCAIHATAGACAVDDECIWSKGACVSGCGVRSTVSECDMSATSACQWDTTILPPVCDINPCNALGQTDCTANAICSWDSGCQLKTGCAKYTAASACNLYDACIWSTTAAGGKCDTRSCATIRTETGCTKNPTCEWSADLGCRTTLCKFGTQTLCSADARCTWNANNGVSAGFTAGGQRIPIFNSGSQRPGDFTTPIDGMTVAITEGFQVGSDVLVVDPVDLSQTYISTFNPTTGILTLRVAPGASSNPYDAYGFLQTNVKFYTSSGSSAVRQVAYTLSSKTVLAQDGSFIRQLPGITARSASEAAAACANVNNSFFGFTGRLASIRSQTLNLQLTALGATGWISATGASNAWTWSGDSAPFWTGAGSLGSAQNGAYAQWAVGEPKSGLTAAFMTQTGTWKSSNPVTVGVPVLCQFGSASDGALQLLTGLRAVSPVGCFATPCIDLSQAQCYNSPECVWNVDQCTVDTFCNAGTNSSLCLSRERCFWDYTFGACRSIPESQCSRLRNTAACAFYPQCQWVNGIIQRDPPGRGGACTPLGCSVNPTADSCSADANCRWDQPIGQSTGSCVNRLCGYLTTQQCWADSYCEWNYVTGYCTKSRCLSKSPCDGACRFENNVCFLPKCAGGDQSTCQQDPDCLWDSTGKSCGNPGCSTLSTEASCTQDKRCYFTYKPVRCTAAQCTSNVDAATCEKVVGGMAQCRWAGTGCRELTWLERNAPSATSSCEDEVEPNLWWLWLLIVLIVLVIGLIIWRLYLAYAKGLNFFEPSRRNVKYSPHEQYAADLFEDAQNVGDETNVPENRKPSLNDL